MEMIITESLRLCDSDYKFMCLVWDNAPISSGELSKLAADILGWKKSTTYTVIKKLSEKGYIENSDATVNFLIKKQAVQLAESEHFVERNFDGSLPGFIAAFLGSKHLSEKEAAEIKRMIDEHK